MKNCGYRVRTTMEAARGLDASGSFGGWRTSNSREAREVSHEKHLHSPDDPAGYASNCLQPVRLFKRNSRQSESDCPTAGQHDYAYGMLERQTRRVPTDQSGDKHLILSAGIDLSSYVGHSVEVTGKNDIRRDASSSSDEATAHGAHFFKVTAMDKDLGACK
jgi:hypothetical protein